MDPLILVGLVAAALHVMRPASASPGTVTGPAPSSGGGSSGGGLSWFPNPTPGPGSDPSKHWTDPGVRPTEPAPAGYVWWWNTTAKRWDLVLATRSQNGQFLFRQGTALSGAVMSTSPTQQQQDYGWGVG